MCVLYVYPADYQAIQPSQQVIGISIGLQAQRNEMDASASPWVPSPFSPIPSLPLCTPFSPFNKPLKIPFLSSKSTEDHFKRETEGGYQTERKR